MHVMLGFAGVGTKILDYLVILKGGIVLRWASSSARRGWMLETRTCAVRNKGHIIILRVRRVHMHRRALCVVRVTPEQAWYLWRLGCPTD